MNILKYTVFAASSSLNAGKRVAVIESGKLENHEFQKLAIQSSEPLTVFIVSSSPTEIVLRVFTPKKDKGESDSGALAALEHLSLNLESDVKVIMSETMQAKRADNTWHLQQGDARAYAVDVAAIETYASIALDIAPNDTSLEFPIAAATISRPNLIVPVNSPEILDSINPDFEAITKINEQTNTRGLIAVFINSQALKHPGFNPPRSSAWVDFRYFAPLKNITEDNASSNTFATLVGYMAFVGLLPNGRCSVRAAQGYKMGAPSELFAVCDSLESRADAVWVGGRVRKVNS
jgi:PhzF family phenazine biosynthesis protein